MSSRHSRGAVKQNLHNCGVSHNALDEHPLPEDSETACTAHSRCKRSLCPSAVAVETSELWSEIDSYTGTGVSTERSSVFSWAYDEFDKAASGQVELLFEEIDEELYEGRGGVQQEECKLWTSRFPHLRILGKQLVCPTDEGFQWFSVSSHTSNSRTPIHSTNNELCVEGHRATLCMKVTQNSDCCVSREDELHRVTEEEEGLLEEYLAFDWRELCGRPHSLPPVSPYRCRREAVLDFLFDDVWQELIGCMKELLRRLWEGGSSDEEWSSAQHQSQNSSGLKSSTSCTLPRLGPQTQHTANTLHTSSTKSWGSKSRWRSKKQRKASTTGRVCAGSTAAQHHTLNQLIMVHGLPLKQRHTTAPEHDAHDSEDRLTLSKHRPHQSLEQNPSPLPRPHPSSRRRPLPPRTLTPLMQSSSPANMEEVIRGTRLALAGNNLSSVMTLSKNTLLPPIGTADKEHTYSGHHTHLSQRDRGPSSRALSAVVDEASSLRSISRPNTTHNFRSDTPHRRSFTVLDSSETLRPGRANLGTDSLGFGVTGISLGLSSSSFLDTVTSHTLDHVPTEEAEGPESRATPPSLFVPVSLRSHSRGGLMTRCNRPGP